MQNVVYAINGPVVKIKDTKDFSMLEMVYVGEKKLIGEVIGITEDFTTIQVYETTTGLKVGEPVYPTGAPMCAILGPGIISNIFDGIERPLLRIEEVSGGAFISEGANVESLDTEKEYETKLCVSVGDHLTGGQIYAECQETPVITHRCMLSPLLEGDVVSVKENGNYRINDTVCIIRDRKGNEIPLTLCQKWPIRQPRPVAERKLIQKPLITGQRVIDTILPIAKGRRIVCFSFFSV